MGVVRSAIRWGALLVVHIAWVSLAIYLGTEHFLNAFSMTCFGQFSRRASKPFGELQSALGVAYVFDQSELKFERVTPFQTIQVYEHFGMGNILVIDGSLQITTRDEVNYHECMVHLPLAYLHDAKKALIIGGGDGGALTRVLQHPNIETVHLVDIDMFNMRDVTLEFFPQLYTGFLDARTKAHAFDGNQWVKERIFDLGEGGTYDFVIIDSTDYGSAESLFTDEFYRNVKTLMRSDRSLMLLNLDSPSWNLDIVATVQRQLAGMFRYAFVFQSHQPTFLGGHYSYLLCSNNVHPMTTAIDWGAWSAKNITTYYYTPDLHFAAFALPMSASRQLTMTGRLADVPSQNFYRGDWPVAYWPPADIAERRMAQPASGSSLVDSGDGDDL